jgi:cullin 1
MSRAIITWDSGSEEIRTQGLNRLEDFLNSGSMRLFTKQEWSRLYTLVYDMSIQRHPHSYSQNLYEYFGTSIRAYLISFVTPALAAKSDVALMDEFILRWDNHCLMVKWMRNLFQYLDRFYVEQNNVAKLKDLGFKLFFTEIFVQFKDRLTEAFVEQVNRERNGDPIGRECLKRVVSIIIELGESVNPQAHLDLYKASLEKALVMSSESHFRHCSACWIAECSCPEFLILAEKAWQDEQDRVRSYLHESSLEVLMLEFDKQVVKTHIHALLEKDTGILYLLSQRKEEDLRRLYSISNKNEDTLRPVADALQNFVLENGNEIVNAKIAASQGRENPFDPEFIKNLIALHLSFKRLISQSFRSQSIFERAVKKAFEVFMNKSICKVSISEMLATYCDHLLKRTAAKMSDDQLEELLQQVVDVFEYITDKDYFAIVYKHKLSKRLLLESSASEDAEKSMISKLKLTCGTQFTSKMEGMMNDLHVATDLFRSFQETEQRLPVEFSVQVLTLGHWPASTTHDVPIPLPMTHCMAVFEDFYKTNKSKRLLKWVHSLGTVVLIGRFSGKTFDFVCSTYQAAVLCMFNSSRVLTFAEITSTMNIDAETSKKVLRTLMTSKYRLLTKDPPTKQFSDDDRYSAAEHFESNLHRIKLPLPLREEVQAAERAKEDRSNTIDASIVRIMKTRRTLSHLNLIQEVIQQLNLFRPEVRDIKQRIEHLIDREFLRRDETKTDVYHYLA